jgi:hypothetical protein
MSTIYVSDVLFRNNGIDPASYLLRLPAVKHLAEAGRLTLTSPVTLLVGENGTGKGTAEEIRKMNSMLTELCGEKAAREKEAWRELGLADGITELQDVCGRTPATGCAFRVCEGGKHIYVAFNCTVAYSGEAAKINLSPIPEGIRPKKSALAICPCSEGSATVLADTDGNIYAEFTVPAESIITWIDGYIDYWI